MASQSVSFMGASALELRRLPIFTQVCEPQRTDYLAGRIRRLSIEGTNSAGRVMPTRRCLDTF